MEGISFQGAGQTYSGSANVLFDNYLSKDCLPRNVEWTSFSQHRLYSIQSQKLLMTIFCKKSFSIMHRENSPSSNALVLSMFLLSSSEDPQQVIYLTEVTHHGD